MRRNRLFLALIAASLVSVAAVVSVAYFTTRTGTGVNDTKPTVSFKPFTLDELLNFRMEIDRSSCGKPIHSAKLQKIEEQTSRVRELPLKKQIPFLATSEACLRVQLTESIAKDNPAGETEADQKLLAAIGLTPQNENLQKALTDVYTEQIAGSYDEKTKDITLIEGKSLGTAMDELTMVHEITHGLDDQSFHLDRPPLENKKYNGDNDLAIESLVEGDAMTTMIDYARDYVDVSQLLGEQLQGSPGGEVSSKQLDKAPMYLQRSLLFPYEEGMGFVEAVKSTGGIAGINAAFVDPPLSTEQIMHPEKYTSHRDNPRPVRLTDISKTLGPGWKLINSDTMGEFDVSVWFEQYSGMIAAKQVAGGWGGNAIQYYQGPGNKYVVVNDFVWDTPKDAAEFFDGYARLIEKRFGNKARRIESSANVAIWDMGGEQFYCASSGDETVCLQAPDKATLDLVRKQFPGYP